MPKQIFLTMQNPKVPWTAVRSFGEVLISSRVLIPFLIAINMGITLTLAANLNVWYDEAYSLLTTQKDISYAIHHTFRFERLLPLYFIILNIWRSINNSPFFARVFSILCISITLYVIAKLSKRLYGKINPAWIVTSVALNPFTIWAAVEIRLYALVILLSALLLLFYYDGYLSGSPNKSAECLYIITSIFALYCHHYLGFLLVANAAALVVLRRWKPLKRYLLAMVIAGASFAPLIPIIIHQVSDVNMSIGNLKGVVAPVEGLRTIYWEILNFVLPSEISAVLFLRKWAVRLVVIGLLLFLVRGYRRFLTPEVISLWAIFFVLFAFFLAIGVFFTKEIVALRHMAILFLPTMLSVFALLTMVGKRSVLSLWTLIMLLTYGSFLYSYYLPMAKPGDWKRVGSYIMASEIPNQPILIFRSENALPLAFHYSGKNELVPIPKAMNIETYDVKDWVLHSEGQITEALSHINHDYEYCWLVTDTIQEWFGINFNQEILERFIEKHYAVVENVPFYKSTLRLLRRLDD